MVSLGIAAADGVSRKSPTFLNLVIIIGVAAAMAQRIWIWPNPPLWLDETWTAMIATRPDWQSFWREAWLDCNPPLYYVLLKLWVGTFGDSNTALRLPSILLVTAAALAPLFWRPKELGSAALLTWAALIFLWWQSNIMSVDARGYALLLFLATLNTLIFIRLYAEPTLRLGTAWVGLCSLMFLTHYYAATLIGVQTLFLLHRHGFSFIRLWPAGLVGIPALAWFAVHLPRLLDYARPDVAWYDLTRANQIADSLRFMVGPPDRWFLPIVAVPLIFGLWAGQRFSPTEATDRHSANVTAAAYAGLGGLVVAFALGALQASLTSRYLVPMVPAVLLGLVLLARRSPKSEFSMALLVLAFMLPSLMPAGLKLYFQNRNMYGYEKQAEFLAARRPTELIFAWDHPAAKILDEGSMQAIGSYFMQRAGVNIPTKAIVLAEDDNPNLIFQRATTTERPAILWLYNMSRRSAARVHPPTLQNDPTWECSWVRRPLQPEGEIGAIGCIKKGAE